MTGNDMLRQLHIIFDREKFNEQMGEAGRKYYTLGGPEKGLVLVNPGNFSDWVSDDPSRNELLYEPLDLVLRIYETTRHAENLSKSFFDFLYSRIMDPYNGDLSIEALIRLGRFQEVLEFLSLMDDNTRFEYRISRLLDLLRFEHNLFSTEDLERLGSFLKNEFNSPEHIGVTKQKRRVLLRVINKVLYERAKAFLLALPNSQINQDRIVVKKKIDYFGFEENLSLALDRVEEYYRTPTTDEFDYSAAIGKLREFEELLIKQVCGRMRDKTNEPFPKERPSEMGNLRLYMRKHLHLSRADEMILDGLAEIGHKKGAHALISEREYLRLSKNITVEVALLLLTKLEQFEQSV